MLYQNRNGETDFVVHLPPLSVLVTQLLDVDGQFLLS